VIVMPDGGFGTSVEEMRRAGEHVFAVNEAVQADLATLRGRLAPLAGAWRGEAAAAFTELMARWDADARVLSEALRAIGEAVQGSAASYQAEEDRHTGTMSAIRAALG
jgi:WXG100 family type VII secretion target